MKWHVTHRKPEVGPLYPFKVQFVYQNLCYVTYVEFRLKKHKRTNKGKQSNLNLNLASDYTSVVYVVTKGREGPQVTKFYPNNIQSIEIY